MKINVDSKIIQRKVDNFWSHIHFHPTDAIEDDWGRAILDRVAEDNAAKFVRIYTMFEDIVTKDDKGELKYDFSLNDQRIDYMVKKGFKLLICFNFMPKCIAKEPNLVAAMKRYKGKKIYFSEPEDYSLWQEIVYRYTKHIVERYGIELVEQWYFHCWNEPDYGYWLNNSSAPEEQERKISEYIKLYDHFAEGILRVTDKVKFGGPSVSNNHNFFRAFIEHTKSGVNNATGNIGTHIDFVSIHTYASSPSWYKDGRYPEVSCMMKATEEYYAIMCDNGYKDMEIVVDEWDASCEGFADVRSYPELDYYRNGAYHSAFLAKTVHDYLSFLHEKKIPVSKMFNCLSGQHNLTEDFVGCRNFFTLNRFAKPLYNGYVLMGKLGNNLIECNLNIEENNIGIIPTIDDNDNVKILIYYMNQNIACKLENCKVNLVVNGLKGNYKVKHYRVDDVNSNAFTKWVSFGRPKNPNQYMREEIIKSGKLSLYYPEYILENAQSYSEDIVMSQNAVSLIELIKL